MSDGRLTSSTATDTLGQFLAGDTKSLNFLAGGGEMGERIRAFNWEATPLGHSSAWPQPLKTSVRLLLSTGHPIFIYWGTELIQFYNDAYSRSIGVERHPSALGQRGRECWDEIWHIIGHQIEQVMAGDGHTWHENQLVPTTRNGVREDIYWTYSYGPIDDPDSPTGVGGVLVICTETTEQVLAEQRLKAAEARWRELFEQAPGFLATLSGPKHTFEFANDRYLDLIGVRAIIGKTVKQVIPEVESQGFLALLDHVYRTGEAHSEVAAPVTLARGSADNPQQVYVDFVFQPIKDAHGKVTGILINGFDSTEQVHINRALQEEDRRKDEFLAMLAHELRNPLAPIRNASELLLRSANQDPALNTLGSLLDRQVGQLTRLVDDLLDISRITQGRVTLQRQPLELNETLKMVVDSHQNQLQEKRHQLLFQDSEERLFINGDITRIVQCVSNVLANAIKYTDAGGRIELTLHQTEGMAVVEVTDSGIGIAADMLPKVFELFVQAHQSLDRSQGGLGIGLSVVYRMVHMHGGTVTATSEGPGRGSTFRICLPLIEAPQVKTAPADEPQQTSRQIMIVDDNVDAADSLAQLLKFAGHTTTTLYTAEEALQRVHAIAPDVVLLDIGLPKLDGYQLARRLRADGYTGVLIAVTGYGQADDVQKGREAGFDHHFTKPVAFEDLVGVLEG